MRKRLVIGAIAVAVIGVVTFLFGCAPRSVEYHRKAYIGAFYDRTAMHKVIDWWESKWPPPDRGRPYRRFRTMQKHADALKALGEFEDRPVTAEWAERGRFWVELQSSWWKDKSRDRSNVFAPWTNTLAFVSKDGAGLAIVRRVGTNHIIVTAPREEIPQWEAWVRKANTEGQRWADW